MINGDLLTSEIAFSGIADLDTFDHPWYLGDAYEQPAIDLICFTLYNLYRRRAIGIETQITTKKILSIAVGTKVNYSVQLSSVNTNGALFGWLEEVFVELLRENNRVDARHLVRTALEALFGKGEVFSHPGKTFVAIGLGRQKYGLFSFKSYWKWFSHKLEIWQEPEQLEAMKKIRVASWGGMPDEINLDHLKEIVSEEFSRFQATGE